MTGIHKVGNTIGPVQPAPAERTSRGIGSPTPTVSPQFEPIAGRAPQAGSSMQAPRLSLSSAQSKLSQMFASPASASPGPQAGQSALPVGSQSGPVPQHGPQIGGNKMSSPNVNKSRGIVPPELLGGNIPPEVFRGDKRPPEIIFNQGFKPLRKDDRITLNSLKDHVQNDEAGPYVSASSNYDAALHYASQGTEKGHVYGIAPNKAQSIDVNHILGSETSYAWEHEIALTGETPGSQVKWGQNVATGERINNPRFGNPNAENYPTGSTTGASASTPPQPPSTYVGNPFSSASPPGSPKWDSSPPASPKWDPSPSSSPKWDASPPSSPKWDPSPPSSPGATKPSTPFKW